jgi:hypothetical protein
MSKEEIRKLLGGYATNTLTANERSRLFEAALDDQELFNALQQEEALKGLLADPAARAQIRHALDNQPPVRSGWRMRWWVWGGAAGAVAAAVVLFLVFRTKPARLTGAPAQIASAEKAPNPLAAEPVEQKPSVTRTPKQVAQTRAETGRAAPLARNSAPTPPAAPPALIPAPAAPAPTAPAAAPPPIIPAPVQVQAVGSLGNQASQSVAGAQMQNGVAPAIATGSAAIAGFPEPQIRYSLLKRTGVTFAPVQEAGLKPGDLVRFDVSATKPGQLVLSRFDDSGKWVRIADLAVAAGAGYTFPDPPIQVTGAPQRYRLALETFGAQPQIVGDISGGPKQAMRAASAAQFAPAVVEITIAGKSGN